MTSRSVRRMVRLGSHGAYIVKSIDGRSTIPWKRNGGDDMDNGPQHFIVGLIGGVLIGLSIPVGFFGWWPF